MTPKERIARLEALLERVRGRKLDPRELAKEMEAPAAELDALLASESQTELAAAEELDPDDLTLDEPDIDPGWSIPVARPDVPHAATNGVTTDAVPADPLSEPMVLVGDDATSLDDYEVAETVELDGDGDDDAIRHSKAPPATTTPSNPPPEENLLESRQRLVSAAPAELDDEDDESEPRSIPLVQRRPSQIPPDLAGEPMEPAKEPEQLPELELVSSPDDEPPPSSRRPIAQQLSDLDDFEADLAPPPVTPPPESGRQVTANQDALSFEEDFTGVRDNARSEEFVGGAMPMLEAPPMDDLSIPLEPVAAAAVSEADAMEMVLPSAQSPGEFARSLDGQVPPSAERSFPTAERTQPGLAPQVVNPDLVATRRVAVHEGAPPTFSVGTFGDLLDAALSL